MKTFSKVACQGEITIQRVGNASPRKAPAVSFTPYEPENGVYIIGHSETGHNHCLSHSNGVDVFVLDNPPAGMKILHMILTEANTLVHNRGHDTHEPIQLLPGEYNIRIAREFDHYAELARQSQD